MADRVFSHVTGFSFLGLDIGATTEVFRDDASGSAVPASLSIVLSAPLGASATIASVANEQTATVQASPGITVTGTVNDCRTQPASEGSPELFVFQFVLRGSGFAKIGPFQVPVNAQIDAFDVHVPTSDELHTEMAEPTSVNPQVTD